ncbi:hypothetical protein [Novosphingobium sp.]|uniref:hypothetical protein n=1 Tax=Novosphingobium sp. TaxID=1874826 RepID=UPI0038BAA1A0
MNNRFLLAFAGSLALCTPVAAQEMDHAHMDHMDMSGMDMPGMDHSGHTPPQPASASGSGTSLVPGNEGAMHGLHLMAGDWMVMAHGTVSTQYTSVSGPRGDDKLYVTSMAMLTGERETGWGRIQLRSMYSLEPAMDAAGYPNLFATGETARGTPLVDRQHPHDLFMELAARVDFNLGSAARLFVYGGPVGEPALGPAAFMMRGSSRYNPEAPIAHHWFDSTHITYGVVTTGIATPHWQIEGSAFRGREPDERRWNIEATALDSWSARLSWTPSPRWAVQASYGFIHQPESTHPGENERRFTTSLAFANAKGLSAIAAFSAKKRVPGATLTALLAEANWDMTRTDSLFGRVENVNNDELFPDHASPLHDSAFRVTKLQLGYARRVPLGPVELALGAAVSAYAKPAALTAAYGRHPHAITVFARFNLDRKH